MRKILLGFSLFTFNFSLGQLNQGEFVINKVALGNSIVQTKDKGYAITGETDFNTAGNSDVYIVKLDSVGNEQWNKDIGGKKWDGGNSIIQTSNGGYAVTGITHSYGDTVDGDVYVIILDSAGNIKWTKTIGGANGDVGKSIVQDKDGGYVIAGYAYLNPINGIDVYVIKLDSSGNLKWTKTIGGPGADYGTSIAPTKDHGFVVTGYTNSYGAGANDVYVIKLDSIGNLKWTKTIGGKMDDEGYSIVQTRDNGYIISGYSASYTNGNSFYPLTSAIYIVKLDSAGNLKWTQSIDGGGNCSCNSIVQTKDGGYAVTGTGTAFPPDPPPSTIYVLKLDSVGNVQWETSRYGKVGYGGNSIIQTTDRGFGITGEYNTFSKYTGIYLLKLDDMGNSCSTSKNTGHIIFTDSGKVSTGGNMGSIGSITTTDSGKVSSIGTDSSICILTSNYNLLGLTDKISTYPNPSTGKFTFELKGNSEKLKINIYNLLGEKVYSQSSIVNTPFSVNLSNSPTGIYLYRITTEKGEFVGSGKLVIE